MNKEELNQYANWLLQECNSPVDEIEWLVSQLPSNIQNEIKDNVLDLLENELYLPVNYYETSDFYNYAELAGNYSIVSLTLDNPTSQDSGQGVILL